MAKYSEKITWGYWPWKEAWNCVITDGILNNIIHHINQYILVIQPNFNGESDARLTVKNEIKSLISLLRSVGALRRDKQSVEEPCGANSYGIISHSGE